MAEKGKGIPDSICPILAHLVVSNGAEAIAFYKNAFGAEAMGVHYTPDGKLMHAELKIGSGRLMLADEFPSFGSLSPKTLGGSPVVLNLYSEDVDTLFERAVQAGAMVTMPLANQFWGDRYGQVRDPFGHKWSIAQTIAKPTAEELEQGAKKSLEQTKQHANA